MGRLAFQISLSLCGVFLFFNNGNSDIGFKCGYESCTKSKEGFLNVHLVAHTHDDVGWLKTVDQLYYGNKENIQKAGVQYIIDSAISSLLRDPRRRFIYVETSFFWKWWVKQSEFTHNQVKELVNEGRLEFIGGGWTMHDEGATHYHSILDQMTWGFRRLGDSFGDCGRPRVGWQIDPFGHSRESASMMARFGFDGLLFGRLDEQEKKQMLSTQTAEIIWEASANLGDKADLFTGVLYDLYVNPKNFCFDTICNDDPIIEDRESPEFNADEKAGSFLEYVKRMEPNYKSSNLLITMGMDFHFQAAHQNFINIDRLIDAVNALQINGSKVNLLYSTPSCYIKAINDKGLEFTTKSDDFFPYASDTHNYWTGYFTSRPTLKYFERKGNNFLQVIKGCLQAEVKSCMFITDGGLEQAEMMICKQLFSLGGIEDSEQTKLNKMREAMGVLQHHDAVSGTEKQAVAYDYARLLSIGYTNCEHITDAALRKVMSKSSSTKVTPVQSTSDMLLKSCMLLNISSCDITEKSKTFVVTLYNPLSRKVSKNVRLPVSGDGKNVVVYDPSGAKQTVQIVPIPQSVKNIPGRTSTAEVEVVFIAANLPALGYRSYYIVNSEGSTNTNTNMSPTINDDIEHKVDIMMRLLKPEGLQKFILQEMIVLDRIKNLFSKVWNYIPNSKTRGMVLNDINIDQSFWWYKSYPSYSGAYAFRPLGDPKVINESPETTSYSGFLVDEVHQKFTDWVSQVIRRYKGSNVIEYHWLIGPIPVIDFSGKEIITRYTVNSIASAKTFYTDSNGREMLQRVRDKRNTYNYVVTEPVAGNYYPVNSRIMIKDSKTQLSVITDRSQGGASIQDGQVELMLHRRTLYDDGYGVGEALNEQAFGQGLVARGTHYVSVGDPSSQSAADRLLVQEQVLSTWTFFTSTTQTFEQWKEAYNMEYSGLTNALPSNIQITTLEPWKDNSYLIRLEHIMETNDDADLSKPVTVKLTNIFAPFEVTSIEETALGANQPLKDMKRLVWKKNRKSNDSTENTPEENVEPPSFKLTAMEIRSFIVKVNFK